MRRAARTVGAPKTGDGNGQFRKLGVEDAFASVIDEESAEDAARRGELIDMPMRPLLAPHMAGEPCAQAAGPMGGAAIKIIPCGKPPLDLACANPTRRVEPQPERIGSGRRWGLFGMQDKMDRAHGRDHGAFRLKINPAANSNLDAPAPNGHACAMSRGASSLSRRNMLRLGAMAGAALAWSDPKAQARAVDLATRLREAARKGAAVALPAGRIELLGLDLPDGTILTGVPGRTVLALSGLGPLLSASMARKITLEGLVLEGSAGFVDKGKGLLDFSDVVGLSIRGCVIQGSAAHGVKLTRCGGIFAQNHIVRAADAGFHSQDGLGMEIDGNHVSQCGDNGVVLWSTVAGRYDGARLRNTAIEDIYNRSGGNGPYGNGVLVWGAGSVRIERNVIRRCAYSAVRNNAGHSVEVIGNDCRDFGEKAMYAEYGARNSTFRDNRIENAGAGIAVANADRGTDGALVAGNLIVGMRPSRPDSDFGPDMLWLTGILVEKNAVVTGNRIVGSGWIGVALGGWRENLRAEDNEISGVDYGVVFATGDSVGEATIIRNRIQARKAAVIASAGMHFFPEDLTKPGAKTYPRLTLRDNETG